jgi:hypothetical protein
MLLYSTTVFGLYSVLSGNADKMESRLNQRISDAETHIHQQVTQQIAESEKRMIHEMHHLRDLFYRSQSTPQPPPSAPSAPAYSPLQ